MKALCVKIFKYAVIHQYLSRDDDYTEYIKCGKEEGNKKHYAFSFNETKRLKEANTDIAKIMLIIFLVAYVQMNCSILTEKTYI